MFPAATMAHRLKTQFFHQFQDTWDNEGMSLFLQDAEKTIDLQIKNAEYIKDPPNYEMYWTVLPGPKSKHKLPQYLSLRPESWLENFHELLAHFANSGMAPGLSDTLTLRGIAEYNVKIGYKLQCQKMTDEERASILTPGYLENIPQFLNHHVLDYLNKWAEVRGINSFFDNVKPLCDDDPREAFLSDYFNQQEARNVQGFSNSVTKECIGKLC
jgi:hypothetical protein